MSPTRSDRNEPRSPGLTPYMLRQYGWVAVPVTLVVLAALLLFGLRQAHYVLWAQMTRDVNNLARGLTDGSVAPTAWQDAITPHPNYTLLVIDGVDGGDRLPPNSLLLLSYAVPLPTVELTAAGVATARGIAREILRFTAIPVLSLALLAAWGFVLLFGVGQRLTEALRGLTAQTLNAARGNLETPIVSSGVGEIGRISRAVEQLRATSRHRLDEQALLLLVSQATSRSLDISSGAQTVLAAIEQVTGADAVRAVLFDVQGGRPLRFGVGQAADTAEPLDRPILALLRRQDEVVLESAERIRDRLTPAVDPADLGIASLTALAMRSTSGRAQGVIWLGRREDGPLAPEQQQTVAALAQQLSVLLSNAQLLAAAETGRRRLAAVLSSTSEPIAVIDQTDRIIFINRAMERAFRLVGRQVAMRQVKDVISNRLLRQILIGDIKAANGLEIPEWAEGEVPPDDAAERTQWIKHATKAGRSIYSPSAALVRTHEGRTSGRVVVFRDITRLKQLDQLKTDLVNNVSHDLRNPLAYMHTYANLMAGENGLNEDQRFYLQEITHGIDRMHRTIGELLDLGRIESGVTLDITPIDLDELLHALADAYAAQAQQHGNTISVSVPPGLVVNADEPLLRSALSNLVNNALQYAPNSGVVHLAAYRDGDEVVLSVRDDGPGIPENDVPLLFDKFSRGSQRATLTVEGSGLGLAIVKSVAERHGGRAWVDTAVGEGSTFFITLPKSTTD